MPAPNCRDFRQERIWRYLRKRPDGTKAKDIARAFNLTYKSAGHILRIVKSKGCAKCVGSTHQAKWYAVGEMPPQDLRGLSVSSQNNLRKMMVRWRDCLVLANVAAGRPERNAILSGRTSGDGVVQLARDGAPREIVRIPTLAEMLGAA